MRPLERNWGTDRPPRLDGASDEVLEAVREQLVAEFDAAHPLPTERDGPVDWPALVAEQASAFLDFALANREVGEAVFHSDFAARRPRPDHAVRRIEAMIRAGQEAEAFGPADPEPTARLLYAACAAAARAVAAGAERSPMDAALRALVRRAVA